MNDCLFVCLLYAVGEQPWWPKHFKAIFFSKTSPDKMMTKKGKVLEDDLTMARMNESYKHEQKTVSKVMLSISLYFINIQSMSSSPPSAPKS